MPELYMIFARINIFLPRIWELGGGATVPLPLPPVAPVPSPTPMDPNGFNLSVTPDSSTRRGFAFLGASTEIHVGWVGFIRRRPWGDSK